MFCGGKSREKSLEKKALARRIVFGVLKWFKLNFIEVNGELA
jgi:hypothetical protein